MMPDEDGSSRWYAQSIRIHRGVPWQSFAKQMQRRRAAYFNSIQFTSLSQFDLIRIETTRI
jgi:hypothetical protein